MLRKPRSDEYAPYYAKYINKIKSLDFIKQLINQQSQTIKFLNQLSEQQWNHSYAPGKWSVKESMIHLIDTERIFAYRALRVARNDNTPLQGFDQNDYIPYYNAKNRKPVSIIEEYKSVRNATLQLFKNLSNEDLDRIGEASGSSVSVLSLGFMIAGHEAHHRELFDEKYFPSES